MLLGLHHHQQLQQKTPSLLDSSSLHLPLPHHISLGSESASLAPAASKKQASTANGHDLAPHYKSLTVEDFVELSAAADDTDNASGCWHREETLALLRIKSEMEAVFHDSPAIKEALWEEVSRKLQESGFHRSAKKCKEKFENVHKYYKKTKDGKAEKQDGKAYLFQTELQAIYAASQERDVEAGEISAMAGGGDSAMIFASIEASEMQKLEGNTPAQAQEISPAPNSPSSISCGDPPVEPQLCGRKRKRNTSWRTMRSFFEDLATQLMERQDALHKKFLEAIEKREEERARREESYKRQEMARMSREQDLRVQEQVLAATRDAALVAFLQKVTGETFHLPEMATQSMTTEAAAAAAAAVAAGEVASTPSGELDVSTDCMKDGGIDANSRRWPKVEVLALIRVRTSLEPRFQEAGPKAQLWEEVSSSMVSLGFSRSAKRCKEKWENINKYYRKTKDNVGRKLRPENATKTCPYFHQLELLYERGILASPNSNKSACKLDGSQTSGELLESSSRDESQQTHEGSGSGIADHPPGSSISNVHMPSNLPTTVDGRGMVVDMARFPSTTCSSSGKVALLRDCAHVHDMGAIGNTVKSELGRFLSPSDQINVNCHPPQHFTASERSHEGQLPHEDNMSCSVSSGMLGVSSGSHSHFLREMMEIQQQPPLYENHQVDAHHNERGSTRMEMQNGDEEQDIEMRMQRQDEERAQVTDHGQSHHDSATLMALVHKLASSGGGGSSCGGPSSEFDLSSSPASSCGQV
ncbi:hypothetical protein GOP47_0011040 [Adiantum capillus-veneris]|uniref:Myb-like domain-containing protein n=1 Tax=Adiantum capillus-veneris TaxID=13818 RepID=A0A9D4ZGC5_ADICA|nr:hypothetical protein GOP47_0011040 [Adiantum capillus-veneris]